jgi:Glutamyl- and glutaminyl-tRNA synthetases
MGVVRALPISSPTGSLHLGNLRTALVAWLMARRCGGEFIVRMEDLDRVTSSPLHEADQLASLRSIGLDWDGEVVRQSERFGLYRDAIGRLRANGLVYECFCTRREIRQAAQAPHGTDPEGIYPGTCRRLTEYVAREGMGPREAIDAIRGAGGVPVLAHFSEAPDQVPLLRELVAMGLAGLEVYYISFSPETMTAVGAVAAELGLLATGGSDYHGDTSTYAEAHEALHVPDSVGDRLHEAMADR